jgi:LPS O-antigen subunit length determinant protein (WzzB/FepE family)
MNESNKENFNDPHFSDDDIDLRELFDVIWKGKKLIILITSVIAISSIVYSLMLPNYYRSESLLVARDSQSSNALSQYSDLASLAGVAIPSSGDTSVYEVMEIIKSREFVKHLMTFENVLPSIMAAKSYDTASKKLYFDPDIYDEKTAIWTKSQVTTKVLSHLIWRHIKCIWVACCLFPRIRRQDLFP